MRSLALQSTLVAAVAISAIGGPPVDDQGQTNSSSPISIPVLINDPSGNELLGIIDPVSGDTVSSVTLDGGATVSVAGDQVRYSPNENLPADGTDDFTYVTNCGSAKVVVAVTPGIDAGGVRAVFAPVDDFASTRPGTDVRIDVLRNDPQFSVITGPVVPNAIFPELPGPPITLPSGAIIVFTPNVPRIPSGADGAITYTPPPGATELTDTFGYTTQGGSAMVTVRVSSSAANPGGGAVNDFARTSSDRSVTIPVLDNDPTGTLLYSVCNPDPGRPDSGTTRIRGNDIVYTPDPTRSTPPVYQVEFCYETNRGTATVTVEVGGILAGTAQASVQLQNYTRFPIRFRLVGNPGVFFDECDLSQPEGQVDLQPGNPNGSLATPADATTMTLEPMSGSGNLRCVGLPSVISNSVLIEAEVLGTPPNFRATATTCPVTLGGFGPPPPIAIRVVETTFNFVGQPTAIGINCPAAVIP